MTSIIRLVLREHAAAPLLASRTMGARLRRLIELALSDEQIVQIDFSDIGVTQSFTDELVGVLAYKYGPAVMQSIQFRGCTTDHQKIIKFVVNHRLETRQVGPRQAKISAPREGCHSAFA